jgi:hypothetical protein
MFENILFLFFFFLIPSHELSTLITFTNTFCSVFFSIPLPLALPFTSNHRNTSRRKKETKKKEHKETQEKVLLWNERKSDGDERSQQIHWGGIKEYKKYSRNLLRWDYHTASNYPSPLRWIWRTWSEKHWKSEGLGMKGNWEGKKGADKSKDNKKKI